MTDQAAVAEREESTLAWPTEWEQWFPTGRPRVGNGCGECVGFGWTFWRSPVGMSAAWWSGSDAVGDENKPELLTRLRVIRERCEPCATCSGWRTRKGYYDRKKGSDDGRDARRGRER